MSRRIEMESCQYGQLRVLQSIKKNCLCLCDCGTVKLFNRSYLLAGDTRSCGCLRKKLMAGLGKLKRKHGFNHKNSRLYRTWCGMRRRCNNSSVPEYKNYGGRGITISKEWNEFMDFREWAIANGYEHNLTIERINNDGNYESSNCTWIPLSEQGKNKRCRKITYKGETKTIQEWENETGIGKGTLNDRYVSGRSIDEIFYKGMLKYRKREK